MSANEEKKDFMKKVTVLVDTREQVNKHITDAFEALGIMYTREKLDMGDYSFRVGDRDFSRACVIERKAGADELYGNLTADRARIEKEFESLSKNVRQCVLLIENISGWTHLKGTEIPESVAARQGRKVRNIGESVYATLQSWRCGNRFGFSVEFVPDTRSTARKILELFFWYWHNYRKQTAARR
ncbi:MAG: ERCC4 domain-containing protein [Ruminococcus sp.]|nr:ERCC4 domain-containing protein [Ruminococcus sp.]